MGEWSFLKHFWGNSNHRSNIRDEILGASENDYVPIKERALHLISSVFYYAHLTRIVEFIPARQYSFLDNSACQLSMDISMHPLLASYQGGPKIFIWRKTIYCKYHKKCRKHTPVASVFYVSLVFSNARHVWSQSNTWLMLLYLLNKQHLPMSGFVTEP